MDLNDKVWPELDQAEGQTEKGVCDIERSKSKAKYYSVSWILQQL